jgi:hypothetical protein
VIKGMQNHNINIKMNIHQPTLRVFHDMLPVSFFKFFSVTKRADEYSKANVNGCKLRVTAGGRTEIAPTSSHQFANNIQNSMGKTYYLQSKLNHNSQL